MVCRLMFTAVHTSHWKAKSTLTVSSSGLPNYQCSEKLLFREKKVREEKFCIFHWELFTYTTAKVALMCMKWLCLKVWLDLAGVTWTVVLWSPGSYDMIKPTDSLSIGTVFVSFKVSTVFQHSFPLPFTREHINPYSKARDLLLHFCWFSTISSAAAWGFCQFTNLHSETCAMFQGSAPNAEALLGLN